MKATLKNIKLNRNQPKIVSIILIRKLNLLHNSYGQRNLMYFHTNFIMNSFDQL